MQWSVKKLGRKRERNFLARFQIWSRTKTMSHNKVEKRNISVLLPKPLLRNSTAACTGCLALGLVLWTLWTSGIPRFNTHTHTHPHTPTHTHTHNTAANFKYAHKHLHTHPHNENTPLTQPVCYTHTHTHTHTH